MSVLSEKVNCPRVATVLEDDELAKYLQRSLFHDANWVIRLVFCILGEVSY